MNHGVTFSHRAVTAYGCEVLPAYQELLAWQLDVIRVGVYWDEVERERGVFEFTQIEELLTLARDKGQRIILTVGVKAPRWPEFYWPNWVEKNERTARLLIFFERTVQQLKRFENIELWQVENEPFDPSGPENEKIPPTLLCNEVALLRSLDARPVLLTAWGNDEKKRHTLEHLSLMADALGIDWYPKQFMVATPFGTFHRGPDRSQSQLREFAAKIKKPFWLAELQAEPWEKNDQDFWKVWPGSISPEQLKKNLLFAESLPITGVLAWGYEYWWAMKQKGHPELLEIARELWAKK